MQTLTQIECEKILDHVRNTWSSKVDYQRAIRDECIILFMLDAGLRVGEVAGLTKPDVWYGSEPVQLLELPPERTKYNIGREIPLTARIRNQLRLVKQHVWPAAEACLPGFCFYRKKDTIPLTTRQIQRIVRLASMLAIGRSVHPHALRHTFATRLMRKTSIRNVQALLGHKRLTSTQIYTHPNNQDLSDAIKSIEGEVEEANTPC